MRVRAGQERFDHRELWLQLGILDPKYVITEEFEFRKGTRNRGGLELVSREYIGVFELWTQLHNRTLFRVRAGNVIGGFFTDTQLKKDGLYSAGKPHRNDAMRHLLHWFTYGFGYQFNLQGYELDRGRSHA